MHPLNSLDSASLYCRTLRNPMYPEGPKVTQKQSHRILFRVTLAHNNVLARAKRRLVYMGGDDQDTHHHNFFGRCPLQLWGLKAKDVLLLSVLRHLGFVDSQPRLLHKNTPQRLASRSVMWWRPSDCWRAFGTNNVLTPIFLQFPQIDPLARIQVSGVRVKPRGSALTKSVKVGFAIVETPQQLSFLVKIRICPIALAEADFQIIWL